MKLVEVGFWKAIVLPERRSDGKKIKEEAKDGEYERSERDK